MDIASTPATRSRQLGRLALGLVSASLLLASLPSRADEFRTVVGAGVGAAAGAMIGDSMGGPTGAVLGAGAGGLIGARVAQGSGWQQHPVAPPPPVVGYRGYSPPVVVPAAPPPMVYPVPAYPAYGPPPRHWHRHRHGHHHDYANGPWWDNDEPPPWAQRGYRGYRN